MLIPMSHKKVLRRINKEPWTLRDLSSQIRPGCHSFSKAIPISRETSGVSRVGLAFTMWSWSRDESSTIWEPLKKKGLHFLHTKDFEKRCDQIHCQ